MRMYNSLVLQFHNDQTHKETLAMGRLLFLRNGHLIEIIGNFLQCRRQRIFELLKPWMDRGILMTKIFVKNK